MAKVEFANTELIALYAAELAVVKSLAGELATHNTLQIEQLPQLINTFHRLKGVSQMLGYPEIGKLAGSVEGLLKTYSAHDVLSLAQLKELLHILDIEINHTELL